MVAAAHRGKIIVTANKIKITVEVKPTAAVDKATAEVKLTAEVKPIAAVDKITAAA
jgi:hypothetical protein